MKSSRSARLLAREPRRTGCDWPAGESERREAGESAEAPRRSDSGCVFVGVVFALVALLATPIVLIYFYPHHLEKIVTGWLLVALLLIASLFYSLFRNRGHRDR